MNRKRASNAHNFHGLSQLTLVEHALCPLDGRVSLAGPLVHNCQYRFTNPAGKRQTASAQILAPLGLSAGDEFFLWGLLALTCSQGEPAVEPHTSELQATPYYCLSRLGCASAGSRGGRDYHLFREAIRRLAAVRYQNDQFYDPLRQEHRQVSFGFFSYSLPLDPASSRAWRFVWDPLFFELCSAAGGRFAFDLDLYRTLDPASRRLFLLLTKLFWRRRSSPRFELRHLGTDVLGFSPSLSTRDMKVKLRRCLCVLHRHHVIQTPPEEGAIDRLFEKQRRAWYVLPMWRGAYFDQPRRNPRPLRAADSPSYEPLRSIGFDDRDARRIVKQYPAHHVQVWSDVTLAALERHGRTFFSKSPQAYFLDNVRQAAASGRTPPDWFVALRRQERRVPSASERENAHHASAAKFLSSIDGGVNDATAVYDQIAGEMLAHFQSAGQPTDVAQRNARRFAGEFIERQHPKNLDRS